MCKLCPKIQSFFLNLSSRVLVKLFYLILDLDIQIFNVLEICDVYEGIWPTDYNRLPDWAKCASPNWRNGYFSTKE